MKKKVLFVITKSNWGGAQRYVFNLATSLPKDQYEAAVALGGTGTAHSPPGELAARLQAAGIRVMVIDSFARDVSLVADLQAFFELRRVLLCERPDAVHLNSSKAGGVGALAARLAGIKNIIFTSHGLAWDEDRGFLARAAITIFSWFTFLLCHRVVVISRDNFARARRLPFCRKKISLIHNGLPLLSFEARERARVSLALKAGLTEQEDGSAFWIGTIAELTRNKGLAYLIEAIALLRNGGTVSASAGSATDGAPNLPHLFIIGSGEEETALRALVKKHGLEERVHLIGFIADAYRYDKAFDCFVLSSVKEGLPTVLLEAGQAGIPVIATRIPGARDIIEGGKTGLLAEPKDPKSIADQIAELMADAVKRSRLADNLREKVSSDFSLDRMAEQTKQLY